MIQEETERFLAEATADTQEIRAKLYSASALFLQYRKGTTAASFDVVDPVNGATPAPAQP